MEVFLWAASPGGPKALAEIDVGVFNFGAVRNITALPLPPEAAPDFLTPVAGGRYLVWMNRGKYPHEATSFSIFDRRTRGLLTIGGYTYGLLADPYRPRVFSLGEHVSVFDFRTGLSRVAGPGAQYGAYAGRADRLVLVQTGYDGRGEIQIVDASTAMTVASFPVTLPKGTGFCLISQPIVRVTEDSTMAYIGQRCAGHPIVAYDLARGVEVAQVSIPLMSLDGFFFDDERQLLLVETSLGYVTALHPTTLATLAIFPVAVNDQVYRVYPGRGETGALVFRTTEGDRSQCLRQNLDALDAGGRLRASVSLLTPGMLQPLCRALYASAAVFRAPPIPTELQAQVVGNAVLLSWHNPDTLEFEVEMGLAPETTALRVPVGDNQSVSFAPVPPGSYWIRVRARNEVGRSPASAELRVDVP